MKKKILGYFLILITLLGAFPSINVNAASVDDTLYIDYSNGWWVATLGWTGDHYVKTQEKMLRRRSDNQPVYCIQPHIRFIDNSSVHGILDPNQMGDISGLSREQLDKIVLLTYYGYGYTGHTTPEWYYATQMMIWEVAKPGWVYAIADNDASLTRSNRYDSYYNEINSLVASHANRPSFHDETVEMKAGETVTLTDKNQLLEKYYTGVENEHYKAEIKGNNLVITTKTAYKGKIDLGVKENQRPPMLYSGAQQLVMAISDPDRHATHINLTSNIDATFEKYYGSNSAGVYRPEQNAEFEIYNDKNVLLSTVKTDIDGKFTYEFGIGTYRIHQVKGKKGYKFIKDIIFTVDDSSVKEFFVLKNEAIGTGTLELTKTDVSTGKPIPNVLFEIHNAETDELVFSGRTDDQGKIVIDVECGRYYILEKEPADSSYKLNDEKMYFEIKEDGEIVKATVENEKIKSTVKLHKVDENNNPIKDVVIGLYDLEGNLLGEYTTDSNGDIEVVLEYGSYYWQEVSAPEGYELSNEKVYFDVTEDGEIIQRTLVNKTKIVEVPDTSLNANYSVEIFGGLLILLGVGAIVYVKNNRKKK